MKEIKQRWYLSSIYEPEENEVVLCLVNDEVPIICIFAEHKYHATDNDFTGPWADMKKEIVGVTCWTRIPKYIF